MSCSNVNNNFIPLMDGVIRLSSMTSNALVDLDVSHRTYNFFHEDPKPAVYSIQNGVENWTQDLEILFVRDAVKYPAEIRRSIDCFSTMIGLILTGKIDRIAEDIENLSDAEKIENKEKIELYNSALTSVKEQMIHALAESTRLAEKYGVLFNNKLYRMTSMVGTNAIESCTCMPNVRLKNRLGFAQIFGAAIAQTFANKDRIKVCSIGSGKCYQELMLHAVLTQLGYQVDWVLIEPDLLGCFDAPCKATGEFHKLIRFLSNGRSTVEALVTTWEDYMQNQITIENRDNLPDVFYAVDLEKDGSTLQECFVDLTPLRDALKSVSDQEHLHMFATLHKVYGLCAGVCGRDRHPNN